MRSSILFLFAVLVSFTLSGQLLKPLVQTKKVFVIPQVDTIINVFYTTPNILYSATKKKIQEVRNKLTTSYFSLQTKTQKTSFLDSVSLIFDSLLLHHLIPYWYGTQWDFNGYTATPNKGKIACGYFVSTTLFHMNLNLNRYGLAKKGPENEAKSIAITEKNTFVTNSDSIQLMLKNIPNGLYFLGLDNHVGYLLKQENRTYFIHSNYLENKVMIEGTRNSIAFESESYFITRISRNRELMKKWLGYEKIVVHE